MKMSEPGVGPRQALRNCKQAGRGGGPLPLFSGRGRTTSSVASVLSLSSTSSLRRSLALSVLFLQNSHLLRLSGGVVRGIDVHPVIRGIDETSSSSSSGGAILPKIATWEDEHVPEDSTFTGEEAGTRPLATRPAARRLRQEKEPAQHEPSRESSRSPTSTVASRDRGSMKVLEAEAAGHYNSTQYLVLEANGVGGGGEGLISSKREVTSAAHADRGGWGQPVPTVDGDGEQERDTSRDLRKRPHLRQPIGGSYSHFEQQRRSGSWGAASRHTSVELPVDAATASSEYGGRPAEKLIDGDINGATSFAHTSLALPFAIDKSDGVGQRCPWWQLDLGATKTVDKVKLTAPKRVKRMRRVIFVEPMDANDHVRWMWYAPNMEEVSAVRMGGVRVLVGNSARNRADTSQFNSTDGRWSGTAIGPICPEPATDEECETNWCADPTTCLNRFEDESTPDDDSDGDVGTAEVDCNGKQGRYVTIELPGVTADDTNLIRTGGFTEVRVEGGPAQETTTSPPPASPPTSPPPGSAARTGPEPEATTSPPPASAEESSSVPLVIGVVLAFVGGVGAAFAMGALGGGTGSGGGEGGGGEGADGNESDKNEDGEARDSDPED